jgi:hypothetical protein
VTLVIREEARRIAANIAKLPVSAWQNGCRRNLNFKTQWKQTAAVAQLCQEAACIYGMLFSGSE